MSVKTLLCNIAIRTEPDPFPPVACTAIINYLRRHGYETEFYDIDVRRPSDKKLFEYFAKERFDIVGISAVVSTGYAFTKKLSSIIKKASPHTKVVVGGNLAAVYEILLRKCEIDICGIGEGEKVMLNIVQYLDKHKSFLPVTEELKNIKGIAFLDENKQLHYTGTGELVEKSDLAQPDYDILAMYTDIGFYVQDPFMRDDFLQDPRTHEPHRKGQKMATIFTAKGCVNTCTFCHRWIKGYRVYPIEKVIATMKQLKEKYNIGFFLLQDECFGEDIRWLQEFIRQLAPLDVLLQIGGVRVGIVKKDPTCIRRLKEVGLVAMYFGMESGCDKILSVMEKRATREDNIRAAKVCAEEGVYTVIQLVLGMPGENDDTINETIDFVIKATSKLPRFPLLSVNYLQSLPGTPSYDFLKYHGLVGKEVDEEEKYLIAVSDVNACEFSQYVNVTESPLSHVMSWQKKIVFSGRIGWLKEHGWKLTKEQRDEAFGPKVEYSWKSFAGIKSILKTSPWVYRIIDLMGQNFWNMMNTYNAISLYGLPKALMIMFGFSKEDRSRFAVPARSLKKLVAEMDATTVPVITTAGANQPSTCCSEPSAVSSAATAADVKN